MAKKKDSINKNDNKYLVDRFTSNGYGIKFKGKSSKKKGK